MIKCFTCCVLVYINNTVINNNDKKKLGALLMSMDLEFAVHLASIIPLEQKQFWE